jgi:Ca-activated chloride channel family protein
LLTDGESNAGLSFDEFRSRYPAGTAPARVFPILFGEGNVAQMRELAALTGGREFDGRNVRLAQVFREIRAFRIYDGPTEVHKWVVARNLLGTRR